MSIFGDRASAGTSEDARRQQDGSPYQALGQRCGAMQVCGTCKRAIFPANSLPGLGYRREDYCSCVKVQTPQVSR